MPHLAVTTAPAPVRGATGSPARAAGALARAALAALLLAGCYSYRPLHTVPEPGTYVVFDLTDRGRAALSDSIGPEVARAEGILDTRSDSVYVVRMQAVEGFRGTRSKWTGERIGFRPEYVRSVSERSFSKRKTALVVGAGVVAAVAFIASRDLFGFGGGDSPNEPGGDGGNQTFRGRP
jgi:hypothetical protein